MPRLFSPNSDYYYQEKKKLHFNQRSSKPLYTFGTEKKKKFTDLQIIYRVNRKVHRFTKNLQGLEGNGERLLLKYCSMKCFTF